MGDSPRYAWFLLALLTLLNVVNFVDRQLITSLQVPIREELLLGASLGGPLAALLAEKFAAAGFAQPLTAGIFVTGQIGLLAIPLLLVAAYRYSRDRARIHDMT